MKQLFKIIAILLMLSVLLTSCQKAPGDVRKDEMLNMGYEILEDPYKVSFLNTIESIELHPFDPFDSLEEYEADFLNKVEEQTAVGCLIVKGKKINSTYYQKDMGTYDSPEDEKGRTNKIEDIRRFALTEIKITKVFNQAGFEGGKEYKKGDRLVVFEGNYEYLPSAEHYQASIALDFISYYEDAISDEECLLYLVYPTESQKRGNDANGYDIIEDVFVTSNSGGWTKAHLERMKGQDRKEIQDKYYK